jgi:hypothetical protein
MPRFRRQGAVIHCPRLLPGRQAVVTAYFLSPRAARCYGTLRDVASRQLWVLLNLAALLGVFLLDDADVTRAGARLAPLVPQRMRRIAARWRAAVSRVPAAARSGPCQRGRLWTGRIGAMVWVALSLLDALDNFTERGRRRWRLHPCPYRAGRLGCS